MRIAHITDLHCSKWTNKWDFNDLLQALLEGLKTEHKEKKIDLVFITGDLVRTRFELLFDRNQSRV